MDEKLIERAVSYTCNYCGSKHVDRERRTSGKACTSADGACWVSKQKAPPNCRRDFPS